MSPLLFIFETICKDDLKFTVDLESYPELLESDWYLFWKNEGEEIVNSSWFKLYSEFVLKEEENQEVPDSDSSIDSKENCMQKSLENQEVPDNSLSSGSEEKILENQEVPDSNSLNSGSAENCEQKILENQKVPDSYSLNSDSEKNCLQEVSGQTWQDLWDEHYLTIYQSTYTLFQFVHYQQYCFYRPELIEIAEEPSKEKVEYEVKFINQTEELKALGLPVSFGGAGYKNRRNISGWDSETLSEEEFEMPPIQEQTKKKKPKKKKNILQKKQLPKMILENKSLVKYWLKRFSLFSRFDEGIRLDVESWFSVTPEKVAIHMAERLRCDTIIDAFCGSGGNAIQFAFTCSKVIAVDIDPEKIMNARHNANIYGVANKIDFIIGDYLQLCSGLKGDVVFLSPPWGGPKYISAKEYDIEESLEPLGATALADRSRQISENIVFFLPKNSNRKQITKLAGVGNRVEIEHNYLNTRLVGLTAIYGDWLIDKKNLC